MALAYEELVPAATRDAFTAKVKAIAGRLAINPDWLMVVMRFESAATFSPSVKNQGSNAVGLIQFTPTGAKDLGVTVAQLAAMTAIQQLDYVEKYLAKYAGKMTTLYNVYLAVFSPTYIGKPDAQKVYVSPSYAYEANKALDLDKDGVITVGEIKTVIKRYIPFSVSSGELNPAVVVKENPVMAVSIAAGVIILLLLFNNSRAKK